MSAARKLWTHWISAFLCAALYMPAVALSATKPDVHAATTPAENLKVWQQTVDLVGKHFFDPDLLTRVGFLGHAEEIKPTAIATTTRLDLYRAINKLLATAQVSHLGVEGAANPMGGRPPPQRSAGFNVTRDSGRVVVRSVFPGGAAAEAGVQPGWVLESVGGVPVAGMAGNGAIRISTAEPDFTFLDGDGKQQLRLLNAMTLSAMLAVDPVEQRLPAGGFRKLANNVALIRLGAIDAKARDTLHDSLKHIRDASAVVVDLRANPGGDLFEMRRVIGQFFPAAVGIGEWVDRKGRKKRDDSMELFSACFLPPVVLLIGEQTGSAAEILAHVLQFHGRATLVGRTTAGAVLATRQYSLRGGVKLGIPTRNYLALDGMPLEGRGVTPDIAVPMPSELDLIAGRDPDLAAALVFLESGATRPLPATPTK